MQRKVLLLYANITHTKIWIRKGSLIATRGDDKEFHFVYFDMELKYNTYTLQCKTTSHTNLMPISVKLDDIIWVYVRAPKSVLTCMEKTFSVAILICFFVMLRKNMLNI